MLALNHKTIDGSVVEIPKFIDGKVVQKKAPERDVIVDRIADIEKLAARLKSRSKIFCIACPPIKVIWCPSASAKLEQAC